MRNRPQSQSPDHDQVPNGGKKKKHVKRTTPLSPSMPLVEQRANSNALGSSPMRTAALSLQMGNLPLENGSNGHYHPTTNPIYPYSAALDGTGGLRALPGRPRRKRQGRDKNHHHHHRQSFSKRLYNRWIIGFCSSFSSLFLAVALWYGLGVVSIATSKLLLTHYAAAVPPLVLTLQQFLIGTTLLRFLMKIRFLSSPGLQPCPTAATAVTQRRRWSYVSPPPPTSQSWLARIWHQVSGGAPLMHPQLLAAGLFFTGGFWTTNAAFFAATASFVETIKAAEPLSSAATAWWWQIEVLGREEMSSLAAIVVGVVCSTLGNHVQSHGGGGTDEAEVTDSPKTAASLEASLMTCAIVFAANLCFSFRGLYQKLFRASGFVLDDLNLQFRMQQVGVFILLVPAIVWEGPSVLSFWFRGGGADGEEVDNHPYHDHHHHHTHHSVARFFLLSVVNGLCFTGYNLASTYILTRISVVHHAALNCLRRVFAIVCTSMYFQVPLTWLGMTGIGLSTAGFLSFTHYKVKRQRTPKPLSSLLPVSVKNPQVEMEER